MHGGESMYSKVTYYTHVVQVFKCLPASHVFPPKALADYHDKTLDLDKDPEHVICGWLCADHFLAQQEEYNVWAELERTTL
eukprot:3928203-Amphidinium_carterae.1